jgi:hypothetical protein
MDDNEPRGVKDRVDQLVRDAHKTAMGLYWDLNAHKILEASGRPRSKRVRRRASVVLVAAAIIVVFFVPLPHLSLFGRIVAPAKRPIPTSVAKKPLPRAQAVLPARFTFTAINQVGSGLELSGLAVPSANTNPPTYAKCASAKLNYSTLRLYDIVVASCSVEENGSSPFWVAEFDDYTDHATARIAHRDRRTGKVVLGPVVMTWSDGSTTHLQSLAGDGSLWLFDAGTTRGAEVLRISEETGRVENTIPVPDVDRPILAIDNDGLWMGVATNGGYAQGLSGSPIYHIAVGSNVAKVIFTGGRATAWMVASGHTLWDEILTVSTPGGRVSQAIWRFDGPQAKRVFHTASQLPFGGTVIGDETEGLWTVASQLPPGAGPNADTDTDCTGIPAVIYINPNTGRQRIVTTLPYGSDGFGYQCDGENLAENQGAIVDGDLYILDGTTGASGPYTELFRIPVAAPLRRTSSSVPAVRPQTPGPLAIGPNGNLYISDAGRDQVLELLPSGRFRVVAGDGRRGFSGDGGPASAAELRLGGAGLAFSRDGTLYIADSGNDRVRAVSPHGVITTVLGDGVSPRPQAGALRFAPTPARRFALGSPRALSVAPNGDLYVAATDIVRLGPDGLVSWVAGGKNTSPPGYGLIESEFGNSTGVAVDGRGNVFVVNPISFGVAEIATSGALVNFGRNFGFGVPDQAAITTTPDGDVVVAGLNGLFKITPSGRVVTIGTQPRLGRGIGFVPFGVAANNSGVIYEDTNPIPQWTYQSAIVSVTRGARARLLWLSSQ